MPVPSSFICIIVSYTLNADVGRFLCSAGPSVTCLKIFYVLIKLCNLLLRVIVNLSVLIFSISIATFICIISQQHYDV